MENFLPPAAQAELFFQDETGAISVDWVVLTAAAMGMALMVFRIISADVVSSAVEISEDLAHTQAHAASLN